MPVAAGPDRGDILHPEDSTLRTTKDRQADDDTNTTRSRAFVPANSRSPGFDSRPIHKDNNRGRWT